YKLFIQMKIFSQKNLSRALLFMVLLLSILAGYYQVSLKTEYKRYQILEEKYELAQNELQSCVDRD
ncbi:hypothetical protein KA089_02260, partial [Candidatus Woesebacteria bacterium]|nr:hypothetical protein [Candidatus Woesebacteria bacterium]